VSEGGRGGGLAEPALRTGHTCIHARACLPVTVYGVVGVWCWCDCLMHACLPAQDPRRLTEPFMPWDAIHAYPSMCVMCVKTDQTTLT